MNQTDTAIVDKVAQLGREAADFKILSLTPPNNMIGLPASVPFGFEHKSGTPRDIRNIAEAWRLYPERRKGTANVSTLQSFIDLTNRHKSIHSAIFAATSWPNPSLTAVLDYHEIVNSPPDSTPRAAGPEPKPQFCEHRVHYAFPLTEEFQAWANQDGQPMKQGEFAAFIEERVAELAGATEHEEKSLAQLFATKMATPADMLALSRGLEVNVAGTVKQNVRLSSGEGEIVFTEQHLDSKGQKIVVPGLFMVNVPAFLDGTPVRLPARLRYRVAGGNVTWFYQLYRWKELLRERVVADLNEATMDTDLPAYEGTPE